MRVRFLPWLLLLTLALPVWAQEESLGDIARKNRERKQQEEQKRQQEEQKRQPQPASAQPAVTPPQPAVTPPQPAAPQPATPQPRPAPAQPQTAPAKQVPPPAHRGWVGFSTAESHFEVQLPSMPKESEQPDGRQFLVDLGNRAYVVTYSHVPTPSNPAREEFLDAVAAHMAESFRGTVRDVQRICVGGHPGRAVSVDKADGTLTSRIKFVWVNGAEAYMLTYGYAAGDTSGAADGMRFLDSFHLLPREPETGQTWHELSSPEGGFRALFPGEPREQSGEGIHMFGAVSGSTNYTVRYADLPETGETAEQLLDGERDETLQSLAGVLVEENKAPVGAYPARQRRIQARCGNVIFDRVVLVGHRIYDTRVSASGDLASSPDVAKFLGSFRLLPLSRP